jgi:hypothetical protein
MPGQLKNNLLSNSLILLVLWLLPGISVMAQSTGMPQQVNRWAIEPDGAITWTINDRLPHSDHIEMSGEKVSLWVEYGIDTSGICNVNRTVVFPTFRMLPDNTRSHISYTFRDHELPRFYINGKLLNFTASPKKRSPDIAFMTKKISQKGIMTIVAQAGTPQLVNVERSFFPSVDKPMAIEKFVLTNVSGSPVTVVMERLNRQVTTDTVKSKGMPHTVIMRSVNEGNRVISPGQAVSFSVAYLATDHPEKVASININAEENARRARIAEIQAPLQLQTPDTILNTEFAFAKIRATESIYKTKGGYMHGPGGLAYYAAIWANDQAEYVSPFFAFSGDRIGNLSAMNCYRMFAKYLNADYNPLPSSIVAEGDAVWKGAGDRGDQAMIAYGASRYALAYGNVDSAKILWPLITWCLEYSRRHINTQGVVESKSDELEGRFPSGKANLSTNCLYYDALLSAAMLAKQLGQPQAMANAYNMQATTLKYNIEKYFGANVEGFETYKYYETNNVLRAWICLPLTAGINTRAKGTIDALFSPRLWTADGLATQAGKETFWDRSTLYALRGVLQAGETEKAITFLHYYSRRRLLGEHVPYPVEAYPEGNQRHLSAESGLYCRIYTEGLFGMRPIGFHQFNCTPRLPKSWDKMALKNIHSFGKVFDLDVSRKGTNHLSIIVKEAGKQHTYIIRDGATIPIKV